MKHPLVRSSLAAALLLMSPTLVHAHGSEVIELASDADGSGALVAELDYTSVARLTFSASFGPVSLYTGDIPAFEPIDTDDIGESLYVLDDLTAVSIEITGVDAGAAVKIGSTVLSAVGDSELIGTTPFGHTHPEWQLQLTAPEGTYGEARISFKLTSAGPTSYAESEIYTLKMSNGPLPLIAFDTAAEDSDSVKCLSKVGKEVGKYAAKKHALLAKCLDKVQVWAARVALTTPPASLASALESAEEKCADASGTGPDSATLLGQIDAARTKAFDKIKAACGAAGSADFTDDDITQHLGLADCRTEELVAAAYGEAKEQLEQFTTRASQGADALSDHFPCLFLTGADAQ